MFTGLYARLIVIGLIVAALAGGWWYVRGLQKERDELKQQVTILSVKLEEQNQAIDAWKKEADAKLKAAEAEISKAKADTAAAQARAKNVFRAKPSDPSNLCKSALDLVNGGAK